MEFKYEVGDIIKFKAGMNMDKRVVGEIVQVHEWHRPTYGVKSTYDNVIVIVSESRIMHRIASQENLDE